MAIRPPVKWHGGKHYLARRIIDHFPQHRIYVEPFGGGASVLLNKEPVDVEVYNDLDKSVTRLFRVLRDHGRQLRDRLFLTPYSEAEFDRCTSYPQNASDIDKAFCDFIRWRQSFGGQGRTWSYTTKRARGGMAGDVNAWWTAIDMLPVVIDRLRRVQIMCRSAFDVIPRFDDGQCLMYCDPPYLHATRSSGCTDVYGVELTDRDHERLADILGGCQSKVVVSGYPSSVYDRLYRGWNRVDFDIANHAAGGRRKRRQTECLWMNF